MVNHHLSGRLPISGWTDESRWHSWKVIVAAILEGQTPVMNKPGFEENPGLGWCEQTTWFCWVFQTILLMAIPSNFHIFELAWRHQTVVYRTLWQRGLDEIATSRPYERPSWREPCRFEGVPMTYSTHDSHVELGKGSTWTKVGPKCDGWNDGQILGSPQQAKRERLCLQFLRCGSWCPKSCLCCCHVLFFSLKTSPMLGFSFKLL